MDRRFRPSFFQVQLTKSTKFEVGYVRQCCFVSKKASIPVGIFKYFGLGCVPWEGAVFSKFFQVRSEKWTKIRLYQSIQEIEKRTLEP